MKIVALIPAKKNSQRLPGKNFIRFYGKNIIDYTIDSAKKSKIFSDIFVSSDDRKIIKIARKYKISFLLRSKKLSSSKAKLTDVCLDFLLNYKKKIDILCLLIATAPLRGAVDIISVVKLLKRKKCHFALATTSYNLPPHQALYLLKKKYAKPLFPEIINKRETSLGKVVVDNGSTYAFFVKNFLIEKTFFGKKLKVYNMAKFKSIDLNDKEDLLILKSLKNA
jgi:CMP-N-acetylneuraminic acid synthetase